MSLEKSITHGKDRRKQYRDGRRFDRTCRARGSCSYCVNNRTRATLRRVFAAALTQEGWDA